ncbi:phosphoribosylformylglycinamidine synthase subunit PurL [Thermoproteus tenax]|uniref:Phosphoribosylformylglycinamidine synthase subunit PurL n=1 Tax=Thermoproteus tenax (strain ATCC 35583 / DSM 2078 / JCM 9277 / NBRC 100435 / Kra 1) TaxID=768679 RepID=G4RLZ0_THETK|nr:phosphoribosylformylglycinamidine synthase subunit PurL [Thermoproteus tenax]CCC82585.1 phosphoribosylformylglycinamidine synthase II [Thermoproteus tenax Kra 1]
MGLRDDEWQLIRLKLGREPTKAERAIFESHWSEHCSYKSTRSWLKLLPTKAPWVLRGPGLDAPLIKITDRLLVTFKIESHNHPSAIDPYNGAATGVGGIIRDILTVRAKPVALLVNLHFGPLDDQHARWIARNVVRGISDYGNRVGVPVVGGDTIFDQSFTRNPIVLATCVGVVEEEAVPKGDIAPGDFLLVAGSYTDRSGLGGSAFASKGLSGESEEDLGAVQVADPLMGKLIIDLVQEARGCVKYIKDLGGGGLATAAVELAEQTGLGLELDLDNVHLADPTMEPAEILASETQERMVFVVDAKGLECLKRLADKLDVPISVVGRFTEAPGVMVRWKGQKVAEIPPELYRAPDVRWPMRENKRSGTLEIPFVPIEKTAELVLSSPNVADKAIIYTQFDSTVGVRTVFRPGEADAAVVKLFEEGNIGVAIKGESNPRYSYLDPYLGAINSFVKAYRNVASVGAKPLAAVDSINVGNPEKPDRYWQFVESVRGVADAARSLGVPVVGGKVSLYNEDEEGNPIRPVVAVVILGKLDDIAHARRAIWHDGDVVRILGTTRPELGGSEYLWRVFGVVEGEPPIVDFRQELQLAELLPSLAPKVHGIHDVGLGGVLVALAKMARASGVGAEIDLCKIPATDARLDYLAYSESNGRVLIAAEEDADVPGVPLGRVWGDKLVVKCGENVLFAIKLERLSELMSLKL